jgi:hypothetical protein
LYLPDEVADQRGNFGVVHPFFSDDSSLFKPSVSSHHKIILATEFTN